MPLHLKVLQLTQSELAIDLTRLHREHTEELDEIARDPERHGSHPRSRTHGRAIFGEICKTYRQRAEAIHDTMVRTLRFQDGQAFTVDELAQAFDDIFEPQRSVVLEHSRKRLAEIPNTSFIGDSVTEANDLRAWFRAKAEHIVADNGKRSHTASAYVTDQPDAADDPPQRFGDWVVDQELGGGTHLSRPQGNRF